MPLWQLTSALRAGTGTLQEIARQLQAMGIPSACGHLTWSASMVAQLLKPTALDVFEQ